jgi:energy-coupling factor transporter transmembrane protein EcfT
MQIKGSWIEQFKTYHKVSLFLSVIIVGKLVILGQIVICWNLTGLGLSKKLWGKVKLKILPHQNMSLCIGDI